MHKKSSSQGQPRKRLTRRNFLALGGGLLAAAATGTRFEAQATGANPASLRGAAPAAPAPVDIHLAATDGWVSLPTTTTIPNIHPDSLADASTGKTTYVFGFRNVTGLTATEIADQKGKAQISAPLLYVDQEADVRITLTNLGLAIRPDLTDSHTIHWHGFRDAIPLFDGVPEMSVAVPIGRQFIYYYKPHHPGTYMYHCHFEDVEHVQMGMTGVIFVRPSLNSGSDKYAYNDPATKYDREFVIFLTELWASAHHDDAHIQVSDWSDFSADFWLMNGRSYPDTLEAGGNPMLTSPAGSTAERLRYQPISSLIKANAGEKVLLRFVSLGYQQQSMTLAGLTMKVIAKDATPLKGRDGTDGSYETNTVYLGPGESYDAIFTAPATPATYLLYNRNYAALDNAGGSGYGGQMTEIRISPAGTLPPQTSPNT